MTQCFSKAKSVLLSLALSGACGGSQDSGAASEYSGIENSFAKKEEAQTPAKPAKKSTQPVEGVDIAALDGELATRFNALLDSLASPCGKAHSLRTSRNEDSSCKRAPYAVSYAYELVKDGADDEQIKGFHRARFREAPIQSFRYDLSAPHAGAANAPVKVVEFFDYGCPACARFHPLLETVATDMKGDVVIYFKQFPLSSHKDSPGAAQAALAAHKQGKFGEMHLMLFENQHEHLMMNLVDYAKQIGLNMPKFRKDYIEAEALVKADRAEGERAGVNGTPAVYINGREYEGPAQPKYFKMWVEEAREGAI